MKKFRGNSIFCAGCTGKKEGQGFFGGGSGIRERKEEIELGFHYSKNRALLSLSPGALKRGGGRRRKEKEKEKS